MVQSFEPPHHETGRVRSGDVDLFYRVVGEDGGVPVVILHGANYYDSLDWLKVGSRIARDRPVMARDARGFGESGWSPSKDYSQRAHVGDIVSLMKAREWPEIVIMGHSMGGGMAILFAAHMKERCKGLVIVDHCPGRGGGATRPKGQSVGKSEPVYASALAAVEASGRDPALLDDPSERARIELMVRPADDGVVLKRDPDYGNQVPLEPNDWAPHFEVGDMWDELASVECPILIVRGIRSDRYGEEEVARVKRDFPHIDWVDVESGHDVATGAPDALVEAVGRFLARIG